MAITRNDLLAEAITECGWTLAQVAAEVRKVAAENNDPLRTNKSAVDHWIDGAQPKEATARYLVEALSRRLGRVLLPEDLGLGSPHSGDDLNLGLSVDPGAVRVLDRMWRADLNRRSFLTASAYSVAAAVLPLAAVQENAARTRAALSGGVSGRGEVEAVRDMVRMFTLMDEKHGGQHGRSALVQYLMTDVSALCRGRFRTTEDHADMLSAAACGVHLAGWKAYDAGEQGLAQRYYLQSFALARESGILGHDAFVMRTMAQQGMKLRRPEHCLGLAETARGLVAERVDPDTQALFEVTHADALAGAGKRHEAVHAIQRAQSLLTPSKGAEMPFWALAWGPVAATVHSRAAKSFEKMKDRPRAEEEYAAAAASRPNTYARILALDLVAQAEMQYSQGHIEQACATWTRSLAAMDGVRSARTRKAVVKMRRNISAVRSRDIRAAGDLDEQARAFLTV